jgi:hypothetical protein
MHLTAVRHEASWYDATVEGWRELIARDLRAEDADRDDDLEDAFWETLYERHFGGCEELVVSEEDTVADVRAAARRLGPPPAVRADGRVSLAAVRLGRTLEPSITVEEAGLRDGDVVLVITERGTDEFAEMSPVATTTAMFAAISSASESPPATAGGLDRNAPPTLWGAFLYSDEDTEIATYVRTHFRSLDALIGTDLRVFVIERPQPPAPGGFWDSALDSRQALVYDAMGWLDSVPYDQSQAYEIARRLGVGEDQLPCLAVFDTLEREPKLVFPLAEASPRYFRTLFSALRRALEGDDPAAYDGVLARYENVLAALERVGQEGRRAEYRFFGHTVFVNRPIDTGGSPGSERSTEEEMSSDSFQFVGGSTTFINRPRDTVIRDFETTYVEGSTEANREILQEVRKLLELVLTSAELDDAKREEAAGALHEVAEDMSSDDPAPAGKIGQALERVKAIVSGAADIARPAGEVVTTVLSLLRAGGMA